MPSLSTKMAVLPPLARRFSSEFHVTQESSKWLSLTPSKKTIGLFPANDNMMRTKVKRRLNLSREGDHKRRVECFHTRDELLEFWYALESDNSIEKHQKSLDTYLEKLQSEGKQVPPNCGSDITRLDNRSSQLQAREGLGSLERYLGTLKEDSMSEECSPSTSSIGDIESGQTKRPKGFVWPRYKRSNIYVRKSASSPLYDEKESGNLYMISTLLSINIAVFIFEIASPTKSSDYNLYSLPMIYGAKVNDLIMVGEWWRLVTPMFLHSGLLHIALSSWVLISFGPQVCKGYGGFTFLLIYVLGGISGNFTSFLHTSEPTVGGSGPVFAIIGAWLIYQMQNKDVAEKEVSESMFQKAIIATALSFVLGNFGPIDNWSNLGAAISGITYGFFTSPVVQVDDVSPDASSSQERINKLIRQPANPFKSLIIFAVFLSFLTSLLFFAKSPLDTLELKELVQIAIE